MNVTESEVSAPEEIKSFRADAARGNDLSMDRPDVQFSAKEVSRAKDQGRIVRMATYMRILGAKGQGNNSSSRRCTPSSECTQTQIVQVADSSRARLVELCRPTTGSSRAGFSRRGCWRFRRARLSCAPAADVGITFDIDAPHRHAGAVVAECNTKSRIGGAPTSRGSRSLLRNSWCRNTRHRSCGQRGQLTKPMLEVWHDMADMKSSRQTERWTGSSVINGGYRCISGCGMLHDVKYFWRSLRDVVPRYCCALFHWLWLAVKRFPLNTLLKLTQPPVWRSLSCTTERVNVSLSST